MAIPLKRLEGKYEILEKIREGGMGAIYKVRHRLLGEVRVIKVIRPQLEDDPTLQERFLAEARAAVQLSHPNIARVYDFTVDEDGAAYIVMEFIQGLTLGDLIRAGELPPLPLALEIARQSLRALGHVHRQGIVHRDVSPDNLMLTRDAEGRPLVKLIDLGLAKAIEGDSQLTGAGVFVGKFRYAAPEVFDDADSSDRRRGDLYSFALVLYELLTGRHPIAGDSSSSLIAGHLFRAPLDFAETDPQSRIPVPVRQAVLRGLAKDPEERFDSASSFAAALDVGEAFDRSEPETRRLLELTQTGLPSPAVPSIERPGSTQSRFNRQFEPVPTPVPEEDGTRTILTPRRQEDGGRDAAAEAKAEIEVSETAATEEAGKSSFTSVGRAAELLRQARALRDQGRLEEAIANCAQALELVPQHPKIQVLMLELESELDAERRGEARRQARGGTRQAVEREIAELVEGGRPDEAARRLPDAFEAAGPTMMLRNLQAQVRRELREDEQSQEKRTSKRRERVDEIVASARAHARQEEFDAARELLRRALKLDPAHPRALGLLSSVEACLKVSQEERREAEQVEHTVHDIRNLLDSGQVSEAITSLTSAEKRFGERPELRTLRQRVAPEDQTTAAITQTVQPEPTADSSAADSPADDSTDDAEAAIARIEELRAQGRAPLALETLQRALAEHGSLPRLLELRYQLAQELFERDVAEGEAEGMFETAPVPTQRPAGETVTPLDGGLSEAITLPREAVTAPVATSPPVPAGPAAAEEFDFGVAPANDLPGSGEVTDPSAAAPEPPPTRRRRGGWIAGLLLVAAAVVIMALIQLRPADEGGTEESTAPEPVVAATLAPGFLVLDATPWAEITRLVDAAGEEPALTSRSTPVVLELPAGTYRVTLTYPPSGETAELEVEVASGERRSERARFTEIGAEEYFEKLGW